MKTHANEETTSKRIRKFRQAFAAIPDGDIRESRITSLIQRLKNRLPNRTPDRHWMYAAE